MNNAIFGGDPHYPSSRTRIVHKTRAGWNRCPQSFFWFLSSAASGKWGIFGPDRCHAHASRPAGFPPGDGPFLPSQDHSTRRAFGYDNDVTETSYHGDIIGALAGKKVEARGHFMGMADHLAAVFLRKNSRLLKDYR